MHIEGTKFVFVTHIHTQTNVQVKVKLPIELEPSHHLLFTFSHIACDIQKATKVKSSTKLPPVETVGVCEVSLSLFLSLALSLPPSVFLLHATFNFISPTVGYAWLPLMNSKGRVSSGTHNLAVSASLPSGYLGLTPSSPQSARSGVRTKYKKKKKEIE